MQLECSASKISRMETGSRRANPRDVRDLCAIYGLTDRAQVDDLMDLARLAREPGWWSQYDAVLSPYIGLEQEAVAITAFSMHAVPALLQTSDYARVTIRGIERKMDPAVLDQLVEARLRRQELLDRDRPPRYRALLDEAVLHREVGDPAVMGAQLGAIVTCAAEDQVTVQVIPFNVGAHASIDSNFVLLEFDESSPQGPVVFVEGLTTNSYLEKRAEIDRYREALEYLRDAALSPRDSISLITEIGNRYAQLPWPSSRLGRQQAQLGEPADGFGPGTAAELEQAALDVHLDRARADEQGLADLPAGVALGDEQQDLQLAHGQAACRARPAWSSPRRPRRRPGSAVAGLPARRPARGEARRTRHRVPPAPGPCP